MRWWYRQGHPHPEQAVAGDFYDEAAAIWRARYGTEPPIGRGDAISVPVAASPWARLEAEAARLLRQGLDVDAVAQRLVVELENRAQGGDRRARKLLHELALDGAWSFAAQVEADKE